MINSKIKFGLFLFIGFCMFSSTALVSTPTAHAAPKTTLGDGTDGSNSTIGPSGSVTEIDRFSFVTSGPNDTVTALTVTLNPANAFQNVASVDVQTIAGVSKCFTSSVSSNTVSLSSCAITVTGSATQYKILITPKTHANMPAVPGASYATTATVTNWVGSKDHGGSDTDSATITIDNTSPSSATSTSGSATFGAVNLDWTSSASNDFSESVILRWAASSPGSDVPAEGSSYTAGNTLGTATVACVISSAASTALSKTDGSGGSVGCNTSALNANQDYSYKVFSKDSRGNYDAGLIFSGSPFKFTTTTTLGDGTDGSNSTIAPGTAATEIDRFSFVTNGGTDTVTALTVTLGGGVNAYENIAAIGVQTTEGSSQCSASSINSNTVSLSSCAIAVTVSATEYKILITPKTHANMPTVPGSSYDVTATVTNWTGTNGHSGSDTDSATITVDNASPSNATSTSGSAADGAVTLNWTSSASSDFSESVILRWAASSPGSDVPAEGSSYSAGNTIGSAAVACVIASGASSAQSKVDGTGGSSGCNTSSLTNDQAYSYKVFSKDSQGNYDGVTFTGSPFTPQDPGFTITGTVYIDEGSTALTTGPTVRLKVEGDGEYTAVADSNGVYSIDHVSWSSGNALTLYLDNASEKAATVTLSSSGNISVLDLYQNRVIVRHEGAAVLNRADLNLYDSDQDADIPFTATTNSLAIADNTRLIVWAGKTFAVGGILNTSPSASAASLDGDILVQTGATLAMQGNPLSVGGDLVNEGSITVNPFQTTTFTATSAGHTITNNSISFYNATFNGVGGGWTLQDQATLAGVLTITNGNLNLGSQTVILSGSSTPLVNNGTITYGTSTIRYTSSIGGTNVSAINMSNASGGTNGYYNLEVKPSGSEVHVLGTAASQTIGVAGNLTIGNGTNAGASGSTRNPTINVTGSVIISANATFIPTSGSLSVGGDFTNNGTFNHWNGTVIIDGSGMSNITGSSSTTFNNFTVTTAGKTIQFKKHTTNVPLYTFAGTFTATGSSGNNVVIQSDTNGSLWLAHFSSAQSISYVTVQDSGCSATSANVSITNGTDSGNNDTCWIFE